MPRVTLLILLGLILGCASNRDANLEPRAQDVADSMDKLIQVSDPLVPVYADLALRCTTLSQPAIDAALDEYGPHTFTYITVYMNESARQAFNEGTPFPPGAIVAKVKSPDRAWRMLGQRASKKPQGGRGGMIKRPAGYDPANGDWEYFMVEVDLVQDETARELEIKERFVSGRLANCIECHKRAAKTDYVFGEWVPDQETEKETE